MVYADSSVVKALKADSGMIISALTANMEERGYGGHIDDDDLPPYDKRFVKITTVEKESPRPCLEKVLDDWGSMKEDTNDC